MQMTISFAVFDNEPSGAEAEGPNVPEIVNWTKEEKKRNNSQKQTVGGI